MTRPVKIAQEFRMIDVPTVGGRLRPKSPGFEYIARKRAPTGWACLVLMLVSVDGFAVDVPAGVPEAFDAGWKGKTTCQLLYETPEVRVGKCSFPPGIGHEKHFHNPHFGYVIEGGTLSITDDKGEVKIRETITGGSWSSDEIFIHEAMNIGDTTTSYLIVEPRNVADE
jgi:hypothetical protein